MTGATDFSAADDTSLRSHTTAPAQLQAPTAVTGTPAPAGSAQEAQKSVRQP